RFERARLQPSRKASKSSTALAAEVRAFPLNHSVTRQCSRLRAQDSRFPSSKLAVGYCLRVTFVPLVVAFVLQLFFDVTAKNALACCSTFPLPQCGQRI